MGFFAELKRRNVYKVAVAYAVVAWLLIQFATQTFPFLDIPNWAVRLMVLLLVTLLRLDPIFEPLRNDPRLQKPLASLAPKR